MTLEQTFAAFVSAHLRLEQYALVRSRPELLSRAAQVIAGHLRASAIASGDLQQAQCVSFGQALLNSCAAVGVNRAFYGWLNCAAPPCPTAIPSTAQTAIGQLHTERDRTGLLDSLSDQINPADHPLLWQELRRMRAINLIESRQPDRAVAVCQEILQRIPRSVSSIEWAATQHVLARSFLRQRPCSAETIERAIAACHMALSERSRQIWPVDWAQTSTNLALAHLARQEGIRSANIETAIGLFQQILSIKTNERFPLDWAMLQNALGSAWIQRQGDDPADAVERAIAAFEQALTVRDRDRLPQEWAQTLSNLANAYRLRRQGNPARNTQAAISAFERILSVRTQNETPVEWARTMLNLALAYLEYPRGDREENIARAIAACQQALLVFTPEKWPVERAQVLHNLAVAYLRQRRGDVAANIDQALNACLQALDIRQRETSPLDWALTMSNLALAHFHRQRGNRRASLAAAVAANEQALEVFSQERLVLDEARIRNNLGLALVERQSGAQGEDIERAIALFQQALTIHTADALPLERAATLLNLARAVRRRSADHTVNNLALARQALEQALSLLPVDAVPLARLQTLPELADLLLAAGLFAEAVPVFGHIRDADELLAQLEVTQDTALRRIEDTAHLYAAAAFAHMQLDRNRESWEWLERGKTRLLRDRLARDRELLRSGLHADDRAEYREVEEELRSLEAEQTGGSPARRPFLEIAAAARIARQRLQSIVRRIRRTQPDFLEPGLDFAGIRECLAPDGTTALVSFAVTAYGTGAVILGGTPAAPLERRILLPEFTAQRLGQLVQTWQRAMVALNRRINAARAVQTIDPNRGQTLYDQAVATWERAVQPLLRDLQRDLFEPMDPDLTQVAPQELVLIPHGGLHILPLHLAGAPNYLLDRYRIRYAPSVALLRPGQARDADPVRLLGVADPQGDLAASRLELTETAAHFSSIEILDGAEATAAALLARAPAADALHIACHGELDLADPFASKLYLAPAAPGSQLREPWNLAQIMRDLRLPRAPFVALTACESGLLAPDKLPDEYLTIASGFLATGARTVLSTLWRVDDRSARALMNAFYHQWLHERTPPAMALRHAQDELRRQPAAASPFYWAGYIISGAA